MNHQLLSKFTISCILCTLSSVLVNAQSPGLIVRPAGGPYSSVLNPNQNGYTSAAISGFINNDVAESEIGYKIVPPAVTEPTGDLATGPSGGFTDIVKTVDNSGFYVYSNGVNLYFRLRIGSIISGSKGYSVLIDTDGRMGNSGAYADPDYIAPTNTTNGNPGFEYEVVYQTNFQVAVYNVAGSSNPGTPAVYALNTHSQISVALSTDGNNPDYFYDWYVPLTAIGNPSSIRMAATTVTSPNSALQGSRSDIYGINDAGTTAAGAWTDVVNAQPPIVITGTGITTVGPVCTAPPTLNSPVTTGSDVSVSGTWSTMDASKPSSATITLYKDGGIVSTTSVTSGGTWTIIVPSVAAGNVFYAKAVANGESECLQSGNITAGCAVIPAAPVITCASTKGFSGTIPLGTTVQIYQITTANNAVTATPLTTGLVYVNNAANRTFSYYGTNTQTGNACSGSSGIVPANTTLMFVTNSGSCSSTPVIGCVTGNNGTSTLAALATNNLAFTMPVYPYQNTVGGTGTITAGQVLRLFINDVYITAYTAASNTTTFSFPGLTLKTGDVLKVYVQAASGCMTVSASAAVVCYNQPPLISTDANGSLIAGATSVSGTAAANAGITLNKTNAPAGSWTGTANSSGIWSIPVPALAAGSTYTAVVSSANGCTTASQPHLPPQ